MGSRIKLLSTPRNRREYEEQLAAYRKAAASFESFVNAQFHATAHHGNDAGVDIVLQGRNPGELLLVQAKDSLYFDDSAGAWAKQSEAPPRWAEYLLLLIPKSNRECLLGDLEEEYRTVLIPQYGLAMAKFWYWEQAILAFGSALYACVKKLSGIDDLFNRFF